MRNKKEYTRLNNATKKCKGKIVCCERGAGEVLGIILD